VRLRVQDVEENRGIITIRETKGDKHRTTILPESLREEVAEKKKRLEWQLRQWSGLPTGGLMIDDFGFWIFESRNRCHLKNLKIG